MGIMTAIKNEAANTNLVETENGALGFANHQSDIVDFFYKVSSMRTWNKDAKRVAFQKALAEDRELALRMLFFVRDIRGGLGERQLFRDAFSGLDEASISALLKLVPEYGRWDDVVDLLNLEEIPDNVKEQIYDLLFRTLADDQVKMNKNESVSLLAKWMPSIRNVSRDKVKLARNICAKWRWSEKQYRKTLSALRAYLKVVEKNMTANEWDKIDFGSVPSKAAKNYRQAFKKHQEERYGAYLEGLKKGTEKVNAGAVYPYEIVYSYRRGGTRTEDVLLENQWKALPLPKKGILSQAIVVRDGSGSMGTAVSGQSTALDVATALAILMSENLTGEFKDKFITFSGHPKFVDLAGCKNLADKINCCWAEAECANTDIEKTMDLILRTVVNNKIPQEEIPAVVIVSDMEFDEARGQYSWLMRKSDIDSEEVLFAKINKKWHDAGYELPKMVFWNVASRTGAVPMQENKNGLLLVSGFSQNILDMLSEGGTMLDIIRKKLMVTRYNAVSEAIKAV